MKLLNVTPLQEHSATQFGIILPSDIKKECQRMGWKKGDKLAIYRQGGGLFVGKISEQRAEEIEKVYAVAPKEKKPKKEEGKHGN